MKKTNMILASSILIGSLCSTYVPMASAQAAETKTVQVTAAKKATTLSASQVHKKITAGIQLPSLNSMNPDMFKDTYKINRAYLKSYQVKAPVMTAHSNEIAVVQVKHAKYMKNVLPHVEKRLKAIQNNAFYPEQVELAKKGKVVTKGNYILLVVDQNANKIINNFKKAIQ